jgi:hypothetical protein
MTEETIDDQCPEADNGSGAHNHNDIAYACRHSFVHSIWISYLELVRVVQKDRVYDTVMCSFEVQSVVGNHCRT